MGVSFLIDKIYFEHSVFQERICTPLISFLRAVAPFVMVSFAAGEGEKNQFVCFPSIKGKYIWKFRKPDL
jgi:hypothetical protein